MIRVWGRPLFGRWPKSKKEEAEFGPGRGDIIFCREDDAVYYNKSWHHNLDEYKHLRDDKNVRFALCPAHQMIKSGLFEGEVILENVPRGTHEEILHLIKNIGERAYERDVMDRIIAIEDKRQTMRVTTTENQLAISIGREIRRAHKKAQVEIKLSREESTARVRVWWSD